MSDLNNNAALNQMVSLLGGGTSFAGLTDAQLRASPLNVIAEGTSNPTINDGYTSMRYIYSLATTNATLVKNTAGSIGAIHLYSTLTNTTVAYLKLYNKATAPIPGTDVPFAVYKISGSNAVSINFPKGIKFTQGLGFAITRGASPVDSLAIGLGEITGQIVYI